MSCSLMEVSQSRVYLLKCDRMIVVVVMLSLWPGCEVRENPSRFYIISMVINRSFINRHNPNHGLAFSEEQEPLLSRYTRANMAITESSAAVSTPSTPTAASQNA